MSMTRHLLVPIDDSPLAERLVELALDFAREQGSRLCFVHVEPGDEGDAALLHALSPALFAQHAAGRSAALLAKAEAAARAAGLPHSALSLRARRPAEAILQVATEQGCGLIFMASHGRRGLAGVRMGSTTRRLLQQSTLPVLVAAVEANLPMSAEQRALAVLRAEHRSMGAVMHGLQHAWRSAREAGRAPDFTLLRAMLYYIAEFPEKLHHPKEEEQLFRLLRARTSTQDALIAELQAQHDAGSRLFIELRSALAAAEQGAAGAAQDFELVLDRYLQSQWQHMASEERLIFPAASAHLQAADWEQIAAAFGTNGDPDLHADSDAGQAFEQLFDRLLRLAAAARD